MLAPYLISEPHVSRRFGRVLRLDVIGGQSTVCSFSCAYCRAKRRELTPDDGWVEPALLLATLRSALQAHSGVDHIVVAGNGEPTAHPAFGPIVDGVLTLRDRFSPDTRVAIVSNGCELDRFEVRQALARVDVRLMKLDAGDATTFRVVSGACLPLGLLVSQLRLLGNVTLLARFVRNRIESIDNTNRCAIDAWLKVVGEIQPIAVQVCGREWESLQPLVDVPRAELDGIADRVRGLGIPAMVF